MVANYFHPDTLESDLQRRGYSYVAESAKGCCLYSEDGKEILDLSSGAFNVSLGYSNDALVNALASSASQLSYHAPIGNTFHKQGIRLIESLKEIVPSHLTHFAFGCSGSEVVDMAIKFVRRYFNAHHLSSKKKILVLDGGYHGASIGSGALGSAPYFQKPCDLIDTVDVVKVGLNEASIVEALLRYGTDKIGAIILEPIQIVGGGVRTLDPDFIRIVSRLCKENDILVIVDEIATGMGRTGRWLFHDIGLLTADLLLLGKGLTGGHYPFSALCVTGKVHQVVTGTAGGYFDGHTYSGSPVGCDVATEAIRLTRETLESGAVTTIETVVTDVFDRLSIDVPGFEYRGTGALWGLRVGFMSGPKLSELLLRRGIQIRFVQDNWLVLAPPLTISREQLTGGLLEISNLLMRYGKRR